MPFTPYGLINTRRLHGSYLEASDPRKRESATVPLWENILNDHLATNDIAVNGQQPVDDTTKAVDLMVRYYDNNFLPIILLMVECKRHNKKSRGIAEMEQQLHEYVADTFSPEGLAHRPKLYGAVAFGTLIRAWTIQRTQVNPQKAYIDLIPYWGSHRSADMGSYKDAGKAGDATAIYEFLVEAKGEAIRALTASTPTFSTAYTSHTPAATDLYEQTPAPAGNFACSTPTASSSHAQSSTFANPTKSWYYTDATKTYSSYSNGIWISNTLSPPENEWVFCEGGWPGEGRKHWLKWDGNTPEYQ